MSPICKKVINEQLIEEYYWHGDYPVYVNHKAVDMTFEEACRMAEEEKP